MTTPTPQPPHFKKVLIANRGEIACRIIRTLRNLGIRSVAVYSTPDANARHVRLADEALPLPGAESKDSYLNSNAVLAAARSAGCDAIHPGYGFLSENATFAEAVTAAGITFIGPTAAAMRALGDKIRAKQLASSCNVPTVPGALLEQATAAEQLSAAQQFADAHGFPILIKASAGGGGRGMRVVHNHSTLADALASAAREALAFFNDGRVFIERLIERPRHIEVQLLGDQHGTVRAIGDRDCSMQRKHQKVLEEAPAPGLRPEVRAQLHSAAVSLAQAVGYTNAGTAEFLLDEQQQFYFLEVNSRLQVEHPVTEQVFGIDLVAAQLAIAGGAPLSSILPATLTPIGHAIEARICAEDARDQFCPQTGRIERIELPEDIRWESGVAAGDTISHYYDPMIAKVIVTADSRDNAITKLQHTLAQLTILGVKTNLEYLYTLTSRPEFARLAHYTTFAETLALTPPASRVAALALTAALFAERGIPADARWEPGWFLWSNTIPRAQQLSFQLDDQRVPLRFSRSPNGAPQLQLAEGAPLPFSLSELNPTKQSLVVTVDGRNHLVRILAAGSNPTLSSEGWIGSLPRSFPPLKAASAAEHSFASEITSPLPGKIISIAAAPGAALTAGDTVFVLESMKMEHSIRAPANATLEKLHTSVGAVVERGQPLAVLSPR